MSARGRARAAAAAHAAARAAAWRRRQRRRAIWRSAGGRCPLGGRPQQNPRLRNCEHTLCWANGGPAQLQFMGEAACAADGFASLKFAPFV